MRHLGTVDFLRDLARRTDSDYDRDRLEVIADVVDAMDDDARRRFDPAPQFAPGSVTNELGAKITHRPDLAYEERVRQAAAQSDADRGGYLPVREALAKDGRATVQEPAAGRPAEQAHVGGEVR